MRAKVRNGSFPEWREFSRNKAKPPLGPRQQSNQCRSLTKAAMGVLSLHNLRFNLPTANGRKVELLSFALVELDEKSGDLHKLR